MSARLASNSRPRLNLKVSTRCGCKPYSDATFYILRKKYSGLGLNELRELQQLQPSSSPFRRVF
jgi:hypothetical protein